MRMSRIREAIIKKDYNLIFYYIVRSDEYESKDMSHAEFLEYLKTHIPIEDQESFDKMISSENKHEIYVSMRDTSPVKGSIHAFQGFHMHIRWVNWRAITNPYTDRRYPYLFTHQRFCNFQFFNCSFVSVTDNTELLNTSDSLADLVIEVDLCTTSRNLAFAQRPLIRCYSVPLVNFRFLSPAGDVGYIHTKKDAIKATIQSIKDWTKGDR